MYFYNHFQSPNLGSIDKGVFRQKATQISCNIRLFPMLSWIPNEQVHLWKIRQHFVKILRYCLQSFSKSKPSIGKGFSIQKATSFQCNIRLFPILSWIPNDQVHLWKIRQHFERCSGIVYSHFQSPNLALVRGFPYKKQLHFSAILGCFQCYPGFPMTRYTCSKHHSSWQGCPGIVQSHFGL